MQIEVGIVGSGGSDEAIIVVVVVIVVVMDGGDMILGIGGRRQLRTYRHFDLLFGGFKGEGGHRGRIGDGVVGGHDEGILVVSGFRVQSPAFVVSIGRFHRVWRRVGQRRRRRGGGSGR